MEVRGVALREAEGDAARESMTAMMRGREEREVRDLEATDEGAPAPALAPDRRLLEVPSPCGEGVG